MSAAVPVWVLAAQARHHRADDRAAFGAALRGAMGAGAHGRLLVTCHRVELVGSDPGERELAARAARATGIEPRRYDGRDAVLHLFRLAAGLESAVVGEDEILHQLRGLHEAACAVGDPDPLAVRAIEMALAVGRRARADRPRPHERSLADRALDRMGCRGDGCRTSRVLVVGAGAMGRALAVGARRRGAEVMVASRTFEHAREVAGLVDGTAADLDDAAGLFGHVDAVAIALCGPWLALSERAVRGVGDVRGAGPAPRVPPVVDLSSPSAVPPAARDVLGDRLVGVDELFPASPADDRSDELRAAYAEHAERLARDAADRYERWVASRPSTLALRALREAAEARRAAELDRLLRRLPELEPRERELVSAFSEHLVASILHPPSARLHDDADGSAAQAARLLFDL